MTVYVNVNGVIHTASGSLTLVSAAPAPTPAPTPAPAPAPSTGPIVPTMTSASQGGFVISATSEYSESGTTASAWKAFNGVSGAGWANAWSSTSQASSGSPQNLQVVLPAPQTCVKYSLKNRSDANTLAPTVWEFQGWNSASGWVTLDMRQNVSWANDENKEFSIASPGSFLHYRWRFTGSGALCQVADAQLWA